MLKHKSLQDHAFTQGTELEIVKKKLQNSFSGLSWLSQINLSEGSLGELAWEGDVQLANFDRGVWLLKSLVRGEKGVPKQGYSFPEQGMRKNCKHGTGFNGEEII